MKLTKTNKIPNTALLFVVAAPIAIFYYATYIFNINHAGNIYLYVLQIIADVIAMSVVGSLWATILLDIIQPEHNREHIGYNKDFLKENQPIVDVFIPIFREPIDVIEKTIRRAVEIDYPHETFVLDDGDSPEVKALAEKLGANYIARPMQGKKHAKSGNINFAIDQTKAEFFAIFDADHVPKPSFLTELLPFFENKKVGLVQTPQHYTNTKKFIAAGTSQAQEIFYKYVQPAKNSYNAAFCVGTNMIYRRSAIDEIGGIARRNHSEDIWTTILLHERGWESVYYNKVLAEGRAPETIASFFRQQNRWARGGFTLFFEKNPLFIEGLTLDQRLQYFFSNIHYFSGLAVLIYLSLPIIYLFTGQFAVDLNYGKEWVFHYLPYALIIYLLPYYLLGSLKIATISTAMASFSPYLQAFISTVLKNNYKWVATESKKPGNTPLIIHIWPHISIIMLSFAAILVGWYNPTDIVTTLVTTFWTIVNTYLIFIFLKNGIIDAPKNNE